MCVSRSVLSKAKAYLKVQLGIVLVCSHLLEGPTNHEQNTITTIQRMYIYCMHESALSNKC